jgi:hypothetical protein
VLRGPQPPGIRWNDDGQTLMIRTGIGSRPVGAFLAAFAGFWTIAALAFVGDMVSALLAGPPPPLGPDATEAERAAREMQDRMSGASSIGDWVMAAVLTVIPVGFWMLSLTAFFASVRIRIRPDEGTVVKGFFPFYSRRSFDPARVTAVHEVLDTTTRVNGKNPAKVVIVAGEEIDFGGFMPEARRKWVAAILRANLLRRR